MIRQFACRKKKTWKFCRIQSLFDMCELRFVISCDFYTEGVVQKDKKTVWEVKNKDQKKLRFE